jgi:hypothetical protein
VIVGHRNHSFGRHDAGVSRDRRPNPRKRDLDRQLPQIGKRPSSPFRLLAIGVVWIVCRRIALTSLSAS